MNEQITTPHARKKRWLPYAIWISAFIFMALQIHSYYYLRFMVMNPFTADYDPVDPNDLITPEGVSMDRGGPAKRRLEAKREAIERPFHEAFNVARMHWCSLSQNPRDLPGFKLVTGPALRRKVGGLRAETRGISVSSGVHFRRNQEFTGYFNTSFSSAYQGIYLIFGDKYCTSSNRTVCSCKSIYFDGKNYKRLQIKDNRILTYEIILLGDEK